MIRPAKAKEGEKELPSCSCLRGPISFMLTWKYIEIAVDLIVIPRSFSSFLEWVDGTRPAVSEEMNPAFATSESVKVDFPWSTA